MPAVEHLLTKQSAICLKKAVFLQKIHKLRRPKRARLSLFLEHSHLPFGRPIVVKPLSNEVLCGRGMLTYPISLWRTLLPFCGHLHAWPCTPERRFSFYRPSYFWLPARADIVALRPKSGARQTASWLKRKALRP